MNVPSLLNLVGLGLVWVCLQAHNNAYVELHIPTHFPFMFFFLLLFPFSFFLLFSSSFDAITTNAPLINDNHVDND